MPLIPEPFEWLYPPHFLLFVFPVGFMPFLPGFLVWGLFTLTLMAVVLGLMVKRPGAVWVLTASPLTARVFSAGQNSFLTGALVGLFAYFFERKPVLAGVALGFMSFKPQLGILIPFALIVAKEWRVFLSAAFVTLTVVVTGSLVCGFDCWPNFLQASSLKGQLVETHALSWNGMPTVFAFLRSLGIGVSAAYVGHGLVASAAAAITLWVWARVPGSRIRLAVLIAAIPLIPPYLWDYDLMILAPAVALMVCMALESGWLKGEMLAVFFVWLFPVFATVLSIFIGIQFGFITPLILLIAAFRRSIHHIGSEGQLKPASPT